MGQVADAQAGQLPPDRILPLIVEESGHPELDCFPSRLQALGAEREIVGANVFEKGRRKAFIRLVAKVHGVKVEEIESDDSRRQLRVALPCQERNGAIPA